MSNAMHLLNKANDKLREQKTHEERLFDENTALRAERDALLAEVAGLKERIAKGLAFTVNKMHEPWRVELAAMLEGKP